MIPIIESIDKNKLVPSAKMVERDAVMIAVKHPSEDKWLYIHYKSFGWNCLVQGGIENGENPVVSAIRELAEETGYFDIQSVEKLPIDMDNVFYAAHKNENRYARVRTFLVKLASLSQRPHESGLESGFDTYENLFDIFGAPFRHHYFLLGIAAGKISVESLDPDKENRLGPLVLENQKVSYR